MQSPKSRSERKEPKVYGLEQPSAARGVVIERVNYTPIALFGCPLGLLGLTLATLHIETSLDFAHLVGGILLAVTMTVFALVLGAYATKAVRSPASIRSDWDHPVWCNFFAVISGIFALLALALLPFSKDAALPMWGLGAAAQIVVTLGIVSKWIGPKVFETAALSPVQFLPAVGNGLVPLAGVSLGFPEVSWFFFSTGLVLWVVLMPILIGRLLTQNPPPDGLLPTLVILIAPPSVLMMDYLQLDPGGVQVLPKILYYTSFLFFLVVLTQIPRLARVSFSLGWWAYTFPVAAFAIGTLTFSEATGIEGFRYLGGFLYVVLTAVILIVLWKTLRAVTTGQIFVQEP